MKRNQDNSEIFSRIQKTEHLKNKITTPIHIR